MRGYLDGFEFRIDLGITFFIIAGVLVALTALFAMATQVIKLTRTRPIETIRA